MRTQSFVKSFINKIINNIMHKGILKISILNIESEFFLNQNFNLSFLAPDVDFTLSIKQGSTKYENQYTFFPLAQNIEVKLYQNQETDTRYGYFKLSLAKLYALPNKNHIVKAKCVWVQKSDETVSGQSALIKLSIIYLPNAVGKMKMEIKDGQLKRNTESVGKMDPFIQCQIGEKILKTSVKQEAGSNPTWNQQLLFDLQTIPSRMQFLAMDKDMVKDIIIGEKTIDLQKEKWLKEDKSAVSRRIEIEYEGKEVGAINICTIFWVQF